jgi:hypothetical protein
MQVKHIKPTASLFSYNGRGAQLCISAGEKFYFNPDTHQFELDQNPEGEPKLAKVKNLKLSADASELEFEARWRREDTQFKLSSSYPFDKVLYQTIASIPDSGFAFREEDTDKAELIFTDGFLSKVYMYKRVDMKLVDSLTIIREEGTYYLILQRPYAKIALTSVVAADHRIVSTSATEEYSYKVDVQEYIWEILSRLIN